MSHERNAPTIDLVRWSFTIQPDHRREIEGYLDDLGADVCVRGGDRFTVIWDEPEGDLHEVVEAIWAINGAPFEVTQEDFQRLDLHTLEHAEDGPAQEAA
jgi:hypothetical protein